MANTPPCELRDCSLIIAAFERGAHFTPSEPAVFATLSKGVQTTKTFAAAAGETLKSYRAQASPLEHQGLEIAGLILPEETSQEGDEQWMLMAKDCLPCIRRLQNAWGMEPWNSLVETFEFDIASRLAWLKHIDDILGEQSLNTYADLCELLKFLNAMCILDLQKILYLLAALNMDFAFSLEGLLPMLKSLITPLIGPPLASLNGLLDQLTQLILGPIDCIIEALGVLIRDLDVITATSEVMEERWAAAMSMGERVRAAEQNLETQRDADELRRTREDANSAITRASRREDLDAISRGLVSLGLNVQELGHEAEVEGSNLTRTIAFPVEAASVAIDPVTGRGLAQEIADASRRQQQNRGQLASGLAEMQAYLIQARAKIEQRLWLYRDLLQAIVGQWKAFDDRYYQLSINKLLNIRLASLVIALIKAKLKGQDLCPPDHNPTDQELGIFLDSFLNPNGPLVFSIQDGLISIKEKTSPLSLPVTGLVSRELPSGARIVTLQGDPLLESLATPLQGTVPCRLRTTRQAADQVNQWMAELDAAE